MRSTGLRTALFLTGIALAGVALACDESSTGPLANEDLPVPTRVEQDGLRFGLYSTSAGDEWVVGLWAKNISDDTIAGEYPGDCMVTNLVAYREGEFGEPAWESFETGPGGGECATFAIEIDLPPGEIVFPRGWRTPANGALPSTRVLGDTLEAGLYRFGALDVSVRPTVVDRENPVVVEMIAPQPVRLERSP